MALTFNALTIPKRSNPNFIMVGGNGSERGFSANEKTIEVFAKVIEDMQKIADVKGLGYIRTYDLSVRTGEAKIVIVKRDADGETPIEEHHTISLYELDDHANLDALRAQLAEKGHEFSCDHSQVASLNRRIDEINKKDPKKWQFWEPKLTDAERAERERLEKVLENVKKVSKKISAPHLNREELEELEEENSTAGSVAPSIRRSIPGSDFDEDAANDLLINQFDGWV